MDLLPVTAVKRHAAGSVGIGRARRAALEMVLEAGATQVVYSDVDHVLRWAAGSPEEFISLFGDLDADLTVVGWSRAAMEVEPERLVVTEGAVNRIFGLITETVGWDLMIAIRIMTAQAARLIVERCTEDSIANDVIWKLLVQQEGMTLGFTAADGLTFRARQDFGASMDKREGDPAEWIRRLVTASEHARAMSPYLPVRTP